MSEEKKTENWFVRKARKILKPESNAAVPGKSQAASTDKFRWFSLVTIPDTEGKAIETFNDDVAAYVKQCLQGQPHVSFLEMYLTRGAMSRLGREVSIGTNYQSLVEQVDARLPGADDVEQGALRVGFNEIGLLITPALQPVFDNSFIARQITPPQVYAPSNESEIPSTVDQFLIGSLKVEDAKRNQLGETPIRALVSGSSDRGRILPLYTHADFDILLKAFPDEEFCAYPLGIHIDCRLEIDGNRRRLRQVDLDLHDTKLLANESQNNANSKLFYYLVEGGNEQRNVTNLDEIYHVVLKSETALKSGEVDDTYEIVPGSGLRVPVAGKVGMEVILKYTDAGGKLHTDSYKFLFRFFRNALRFSTMTNRLTASGQFIPGKVETSVMLPPLQKDGVREMQTPAFIIKPLDEGTGFEIRQHPDSTLNLAIEGVALDGDPIQVDLTDTVEIRGEMGTEGSSHKTEGFTFKLRSLAALNEQRNKVAAMREDRNYVAFVEVASERSISLANSEVVLGRNQLLDRSAGVGLNALTLSQRYVTWVMTAKKDEKVLYYSTVQGAVAQPVTELTKPVALGLVGTYYVYVGDFEFMIFLESTPRTEIQLDSGI